MSVNQEAAVDMDSVAGLPDLSKLPGFAADDVAANLGGRLSEAQSRALRVEVRNRGLGLAAIVGFSIVYWVGGADYLSLAVLAIVVLVSAHRFAMAIADMNNPVVSAVEGAVSVEWDGDGDHVLRVEGRKFSLSKAASIALLPGGPYRVFFLDRANLVIGAQVLPGWQPRAPRAKKRFRFSAGVG